MADPETGRARLSDEELDSRIAAHTARSGQPAVISLEEFEAAQRDPAVIAFLQEAQEEAERWEETEWGYQLKPEYRPGE
jgi:hypothetical protein